MSVLLRSSRILGRAVASSSTRPATAVVGSSSNGRFMGTSSRHDNDPEVIERNKQSVLRKNAKGSTEVPHWHEELATDAEAFVKSYREEIDSSGIEIAKVQKATKKSDSKSTTKE